MNVNNLITVSSNENNNYEWTIKDKHSERAQITERKVKSKNEVIILREKN